MKGALTMAKNFRKIYEAEPELKDMRLLRIPDIMTERVSSWTYADMKREFKKSMGIFSENGFEDESAYQACEAVRLSVFRGENREKAYAMTENIMALTILINTALGLSYIHPYLPENYERFISEYRSSPTHGLVLSPGEQAELDRDIGSALERLRGYEPEPRKPFEPKFANAHEIGANGADYKWFEENYIDPPADSDARMKARLSDTAYRMMTEFERSKIISPDKYEKEFLLPNGLKMTDKLRDLIEVYGGRVFAWRKQLLFCMDDRWSQTPLWGYTIGFSGRRMISRDGVYYIEAMNEHTTQDYGLHIGSNGKVYDCAMGCLYFKANSMEEFLESEARGYRRDELLLERRRELENKYLIPEIRTASM